MPEPDYKRKQRERRFDQKAEEAQQRIQAREEVEGVAAAPRLGWHDKTMIADHFVSSVSWIEKRMAEGMPHAVIAGRPKFKPAECEPWLEEHGYLVWKGDR